MRIVLDTIADPPPQERRIEIVERKGLGHPDTICDALAEETSRALCRYYLGRFGRVLHHNVDKVLLCGGASVPLFGGGHVVEPIEIILAGRVTSSYGGVQVPVQEIAIESCRAWLRAHLHELDPERDVRIVCRFRAGSSDLVELFDRRRGQVALANDTSIGVGFAPLSPLESALLDLERWINDPSTKRDRPETGEDVKVMGVRIGDQTSLTVACAFVSAHVADIADYQRKSSQLADALRRRAAARLGGHVEVALNAADDPDRGSVYLTVTGTSAESGDDGEVGRGNRTNGLITPGRPMTLEAAAGKNPVSHVGKLYNVIAGRIARDLVSRLPGAVGAECTLVSRIGSPVDDPHVVGLRLHTCDDRPADAHATAVGDIIRDNLSRLASDAASLVDGTLGLY